MLTPIHRALGRTPSPVTWELLEEGLREQVQEQADLDWKQTVYDHRDPKWQDEAAKDIAAMANSGGGWIVFGIAEDRETSAATEITGVTWGQSDEQRLLRVAYTRIGPPVLGLEFTVVQDPSADASRSVVLMRVPDSPERPHLARKGGDAFVAPVRNGARTDFMADQGIERAFRERFALRAEREESIQALYEETAEHVNPATAVCFVLVAVPAQHRQNPTEIDAAALHALFTQTQAGMFYNPRLPVSSPWRLDTGNVRRGRRLWTMRTSERDRPTFRAVHEDGTVQTAFRLGGVRRDLSEAPSHCMSVHVEHALMESLALTRKWAAHQDIQGGYRVRTGLVARLDEPIHVRSTDTFGQTLDVEQAEPIHRFHPVTVELDPLGAVDDLVPVVAEVALDLINQGGVRYLMAIHEQEQNG